MSMTPEAKAALSSTIRGLRERLLTDLRAAAETEYRLSIRVRDAGLDESARTRRGRFETWLAEQVRAQDATAPKSKRTEDDFRREAEKQAAYTLLNRLVLLRLMEAPGPSGTPLRSPAVLTGGWESRAYLDFRQLAPGLVRDDETEGYAFLLRLVFEDLAIDLPGLYGPNGIGDLIPVPASTLRHVVDKLNAPALESCWTDEMTLGWVYQYWNDPDREALDAKLNSRGKLEPYEIASKTQMFTERYMVDWLLQNSIGPMWLAMCKKHGWTPDVEKEGTLAALEARREDWRAKRQAGTVDLTALMPLHSDTERRWAYYLPQPIPEDPATPESIRDIKLCDPAVGSGHFLVVALDLLAALYREEARHRGKSHGTEWTERAIVERILTHNLYGIDLDPRAVQIAVAALWLRARQMAPDVHPQRLNLVASNLRLASLPDDDAALVELRREVDRETGIPAALTDSIIHGLRGADYLGSLLKIDSAVEHAIDQYEGNLGKAEPKQGRLFSGFAEDRARTEIDRDKTRATLLDLLESFLAKHTNGDDLGLRMHGEQLAAGVRFLRMIREDAYDIVVANPPYQATAKLSSADYIARHYELAKADLYAAFLLRGLELIRDGGFSSMLTMRNWMFIRQYGELRRYLLANFQLRALEDLSSGAFEEISGLVVSVVGSIFRRCPATVAANALKVFNDSRVTQPGEAARKRAAALCQSGRYEFDPLALRSVPEWPLVYWWSQEFINRYRTTPLLGSVGAVRQGLTTSNNERFLRLPWEVGHLCLRRESEPKAEDGWVPYIKGSQGNEWIEPVSFVVDWRRRGLAIKVLNEWLYGSYTRSVRSEDRYFEIGTAYTTMGTHFGARSHRFRSICDAKGRSVYGLPHRLVTCLLNSKVARETVESLNPTIDFSVGDVNRLPIFPVTGAEEIFSHLETAFANHEAHREPSVEFRRPGASSWRSAQRWAQNAVDRPESRPIPEYSEEFDPEDPAYQISFAIGVALGRFSSEGAGVLDPGDATLSNALPDGILFLDTTLPDAELTDSLGDSRVTLLHQGWTQHASAIGSRKSLRGWLAHDFFSEVHKNMYQNRPIYWPLSSDRRTFVVLVNMHRLTDKTLRLILADYLVPTLTRLEGELHDLRGLRDGAGRGAVEAERSYERKGKARDELKAFIGNLEQCANRGAPPTDPKCPAREQDARYDPVIDDGVVVNSAALWPLLDPQWRDPKKWWKELAIAQDGKNYEWSHLARRYWPRRVDERCRTDPSLAVAHGCFWLYHPARAWSWELRLQRDIGPDFRITEAPYRPDGREVGDAGDGPHREAWLRDHPDEALSAVEREAERRMGRGKKRAAISEMRILETRLWTRHASEIWNMELRLAEKQGRELRILAPDEPEARARFERENPGKVVARARLLESLVPPADWLEESNVESVGSDDGEDAELAEIDGEEESQ